jgi:hypothetical protein
MGPSLEERSCDFLACGHSHELILYQPQVGENWKSCSRNLLPLVLLEDFPNLDFSWYWFDNPPAPPHIHLKNHRDLAIHTLIKNG